MPFKDELKNDWMLPPNIVTEIRVLLCWLPGALLLTAYFDQTVSYSGFCWHAIVAFAIIALTDFADGRMARKMHMVTELGTILDPIVDKLLVGLTMVALMIVQPVTIIPFAIMLVREIYVGVMLNNARHKGKNPRVIYTGKVKMWAQCITVLVFMVPFTNVGWLLWVKWICMSVALALTLKSGYEYYEAFREVK